MGKRSAFHEDRIRRAKATIDHLKEILSDPKGYGLTDEDVRWETAYLRGTEKWLKRLEERED